MLKFLIILTLSLLICLSSFPLLTQTKPASQKIIIINQPYNKLMIVAHPDDETLWGYYYLKNFDNWKILCITNSNNPTRVQELTNIAKKFNTALEIWNYQDSPHSYNMHPQIYKDIHRAINLDPNVQIVLTHNPLGEYGHIQHIKVSNVVLTVSKKPTYVFSYSSKKGEQKEKCELKNIYKSQEKIFEEHCKKIIPQKIYKLK